MEFKIEIQNVELFTNEKKSFVKMQIQSRLVLKIQNITVARDISNTVQIGQENKDLLTLMFQEGTVKKIDYNLTLKP